jgi:hypothetical protein
MMGLHKGMKFLLVGPVQWECMQQKNDLQAAHFVHLTHTILTSAKLHA